MVSSCFQCLDVVKTGLADQEVRPSRRYLLYQRAEKICGGPNSKYADQLTKIETVRVTDAPEVVFSEHFMAAILVMN